VEFQSTHNANMPLRMLLYIGRLYERMLGERSLYRSSRAEGRAKGSAAKALEIARNLLAIGDPAEKVAQVTGLTLAEVEALAER